MVKIETPHGTIHYGETVIKKIITKCIEQYGGNVLLYNYSKKLPGIVPGWGQKKNLNVPNSNTIKILRIEDEDGEFLGIEITIFVVVKFGTSINRITNGIIDYIYENVEKITDIKPSRVTVNVTGVLSKSMVRRDIEVSR